MANAYLGEEESTFQEPLSPGARLFHSQRLNCCIVAIIGSKTTINPSIVKQGLEQTLIKHPRFSSKLVEDGSKCGKRKWSRAIVNIDDHIIIPDLDPNVQSPDQFIEDYVSHLTTLPMDLSKPLWELHILNVKNSDAEAVAVFRIHHSIGDGASLISLLLACTRKTSNPGELPSVPVQKRRARSTASSAVWWFFVAIWMALVMIWNTIIDMILFSATMLFLKDTNSPLKGAPGVELKPRRFVHQTISLDDIKLVKNAMDMTINDVVLGIIQAGLSQYLNRKYGKKGNLPRSMRIRSTVLVNLRPTVGVQALADLMAKGAKAKWGWGNSIGYIILPFTIALQDNPLDYLLTAKATIDRKKLSFEPFCTYKSAVLVLKSLGVKAAATIALRVLSNTTLAFSNVVGPVEEISFYGHPIAYLAPSVYGNPQALTVHFQSYCNKMTMVLAVDPDTIPDPHQLCNDIEESLDSIKNAVKERRLSPA